MDEFGDIEGRRDANTANLRRAFGAPVRGEPPAFAVLLQRLAAKAGTRPEARSDLRPGASAPAGSPGASFGAAWSHSLADT